MLRLLIVLVSCYTVTCRRAGGIDSDSGNCRPDEKFKYMKPCPGEVTCRTRGVGISCLAVVQDPEPKCVCKEGLYRADNGSCYTKEQCDKLLCPGANQFHECGDQCDNVCATLDKQNRTNCPSSVYTYICRPQCYCNDGYARDHKGNCIPIEHCDLLTHTNNKE